MLTEKQIAILTEPTPKKEIKIRKGRTVLRYVSISYVIGKLNHAFGHAWDFVIVNKEVTPKQIIIHGRLTVTDSPVPIVKEHFGVSDIIKYKGTDNPVSIGDDTKSAASDCIKKCATLLGVALDIHTEETNGDGSDGDGEDKVAEFITRIRDISNIHECRNWWKKHEAEIKALSQEQCALIKLAVTKKRDELETPVEDTNEEQF